MMMMAMMEWCCDESNGSFLLQRMSLLPIFQRTYATTTTTSRVANEPRVFLIRLLVRHYTGGDLPLLRRAHSLASRDL